MRFMQGFLIFALGDRREGGEAGVLADGDEAEHNFSGEENNDDGTDCYQSNCHCATLF